MPFFSWDPLRGMIESLRALFCLEETMEGTMTLGSLFDGSGGFCLAGTLAGVKPVFLSEVEPFAVRVTEKRFPDVKHYGDVSKLRGGDLEAVDIITFGSPC